MPKLPVARVLWKPLPDMKQALASWIYAGGAHHTGYSQNLTGEHLQDFADMAGIEFININATSTTQSIRNELRWNEVYYQINKS